MEHSTDSQRAWELLIARLEAIEHAQNRSDEADIEAWREYRTKCEAYDKTLTAVKADLTALQLQTAKNHVRTPMREKVIWALATAAAAWFLARLGVDVPAVVSIVGKLMGGP